MKSRRQKIIQFNLNHAPKLDVRHRKRKLLNDKEKNCVHEYFHPHTDSVLCSVCFVEPHFLRYDLPISFFFFIQFAIFIATVLLRFCLFGYTLLFSCLLYQFRRSMPKNTLVFVKRYNNRWQFFEMQLETFDGKNWAKNIDSQFYVWIISNARKSCSFNFY